MTKKLSDITTSYRSFEDDQVLTADQLNIFLNYFDDQDRMSRIFLSGVGIVCGFKLKYEGGILSISQGTGTTTDGDLLRLLEPKNGSGEQMALVDIKYKSFRPYADDKVGYKPFFYPNGDTQPQMDIWELIPETETVQGAAIDTLPNLLDKVVLLYLESYSDDPDLCVGLNCDNLGINEVQKLRVLVVSQANADFILSRDPMFNAGNLLTTYMGLHDVTVPRVILNQVNTATYAALRDAYKNAITADSVVDNMKASFTQMLTKAGLASQATEINSKLTALFSPTAVQNQPALYFQYRYDALKDIVDTYMEMKELFLSESAYCCPDINAFPKHLMLGKLQPTPDDTLYQRYRHKFYASPILREGHDSFGEFRNLVDRVLLQLNRYIATNIPRGEIKITPSVYGPAPLGDGAIPYYYNVQNDLLKSWNYEKAMRNKQRRNLSYHTALLDQSPAIQKPLRYNLEPYDFMRFEGHQGYLYKEAMDKINTIKQTNGLNFDLKALGITISPNETINIADYECEFADLNTMLKAIRSEHECALANASYYLSSYSLTKQNVNDREVEFFYPLKPRVPLATLTPVKTNVVLANLSTAPNTTGRIMGEVFRTFDGCSANDIVAQVNLALSRYSFGSWDKVVYENTISKPAEILSNALLLVNSLSVPLAELNRDRIAQYSINARNICGLARRVNGINTGELNPSTVQAGLPSIPALRVGDFNKDFNADYASAIPLRPAAPAMINTTMNQLAKVCCSTKQLETIMDEIEARKQKILLGLKLSKFIESHPGLEHMAGTRPGGTFVLAYLTNSVSGIPANTVIADFTLPYMCCSDCAPVNFIMPRPAASLSLSQDRFCIGNDSSPLVFTPYPLNGVIKADRVVPGLTINGTQLLINPSQIPTSILGTPIYFTVNDQITGCSLTIYRSPQANFNVPSGPTTQTQITFQPIGLFEPGTTYFWSFGDGSVSTEKVVNHQYAYPVNDDNKVTVSLTVTPPNGACPTTVKKDITFLDYQVSIEPKEFCNSDTAVYPFTVLPADAEVTIEGEGVVTDEDGEYAFKPSEATPGDVTIYVNGSPWITLKVKPNPTCDIEGEATTEGLVLTSNMDNVGTYVWSFTDTEGTRIHPNISTIPDPTIPWSSFSTKPSAVVATLYVNNGCGSYSQTITVQYPIDFASCSLEASDSINEAEGTLIDMMSSGSYALLSDTQKDLFVYAKNSVFKPIMDDLTFVLEGGANGATASLLSGHLNQIHGEIVTTNALPASDTRTARLDLLKQLYAIEAYSLFPSIIRCQMESALGLDSINNLFKLITDHLSASFGDSFKQMNVDPDPDGTYVEILNEVREYRATGSNSYNALNFTIQLLQMI